jgi:hypothetical protein
MPFRVKESPLLEFQRVFEGSLLRNRFLEKVQSLLLSIWSIGEFITFRKHGWHSNIGSFHSEKKWPPGHFVTSKNLF